MNTLFYGDEQMGFLPASGAPSANGRFNQVVDLIRGGIDTYRQNRSLPQYYPPQQQPIQTQPPYSTSTPPESRIDQSPRDDAGENDSSSRKKSKGSGFGLSWDNEGLHLGDSITLSPTMLIVIAAGIYLLQSPGVTRRGRS